MRRGTWSSTGRIEEREALRDEVPKLALDAPHARRRHAARLRARGARRSPAPACPRRAQLNSAGDNESGFLDPLDEIVETGMVPAQRLLDKFHGEWGGDISRIYDEFSF